MFYQSVDIFIDQRNSVFENVMSRKTSALHPALLFFFFLILQFVGHLVKYYSLKNKNIARGWLPPAGFHLSGCLLYFYCKVCGMLLLQSSFYYVFIRFSWFGCVTSISL